MSGKMNLKELYEIMNAMASKQELDAALQKMAADGETDSIAEALVRLSELNEGQLDLSKEENAFRACIGKVYEQIFDGIENQTYRWNENNYWNIEAIRKAEKSFENCFRDSNTTYARSSWYEKTKRIKPKQKVSDMQMPDEEMIMQCCIGLHRTENEAVNLMILANYHPFIGQTQVETQRRRSMYQVLQRPQYCAKQWNTMFFGRAKASDVMDYTQDICSLIADALKNEGWTKTEQEKKVYVVLAKKYDQESGRYRLLLDLIEKRLKRLENLQCLSKSQISELLKSLEKKDAFHEITLSDKQLYKRIVQKEKSVEGSKELNQIRLEQIIYLSAALRFRKKDVAWMLQRLGYFKQGDSLVGSEGDGLMNEEFISGLLEEDEKKRSHFVNPSEKAQLEVYGKLFSRLIDYRRWTKKDVQDAIEKWMAKNDRNHIDALIDLLCSARLEGVDVQAVKSGRWIPDDESMRSLENVLGGEEMMRIRSNLDQIRKLYAKRVEKLLDACYVLGMTQGDALGLLETAGVKPTPVMKRMASDQNEKKPVDGKFCEAMLRAFMANAKDCMPCAEPDDMAVTAMFNRLIPVAKEQGGAKLLTEVLNSYFSQMQYKETEKKVCGELDRLGVIPKDRTLMEIVKLAI